MQKAAVVLLYGLFYAVFSACGIHCIWHDIFHILCPGCGLTRGCLAALSGDVSTAMRFHPMFWCVPLLLLYFFTDGKPLKNKIANRLLFFGILGGLSAVWVYRLCTGFTFD